MDGIENHLRGEERERGEATRVERRPVNAVKE
jgi:hypothetical protein